MDQLSTKALELESTWGWEPMRTLDAASAAASDAAGNEGAAANDAVAIEGAMGFPTLARGEEREEEGKDVARQTTHLLSHALLQVQEERILQGHDWLHLTADTVSLPVCVVQKDMSTPRRR